MEKAKFLNTFYGVAEDCHRLLDRFESFKSYRFSDFAFCWRESMFSHILSGRFRWSETAEFLDHLFTVCVRALVDNSISPSGWIRRAGAIYICYGLYNKLPQATRRFVSLRVTLAEWRRVEHLLRHVRQQNHHDAHYALMFLFQQGAFQFVAAPVQMAPDLYRGKSGFITNSAIFSQTLAKVKQEESVAHSSSKAQLVDSLSQLSTIHERYVAMKSALFSADDRLDSVCENPTVGVCQRLDLPMVCDTTVASSVPLSGTAEADGRNDGVVSRHVSSPDTSQQSENIGDVRCRVRRKAVARFRPTDS